MTPLKQQRLNGVFVYISLPDFPCQQSIKCSQQTYLQARPIELQRLLTATGASSVSPINTLRLGNKK